MFANVCLKKDNNHHMNMIFFLTFSHLEKKNPEGSALALPFISDSTSSSIFSVISFKCNMTILVTADKSFSYVISMKTGFFFFQFNFRMAALKKMNWSWEKKRRPDCNSETRGANMDLNPQRPLEQLAVLAFFRLTEQRNQVPPLCCKTQINMVLFSMNWLTQAEALELRVT